MRKFALEIMIRKLNRLIRKLGPETIRHVSPLNPGPPQSRVLGSRVFCLKESTEIAIGRHRWEGPDSSYRAIGATLHHCSKRHNPQILPFFFFSFFFSPFFFEKIAAQLQIVVGLPKSGLGFTLCVTH